MEERQQVFSLYASSIGQDFLSATMEMRIKVFPYTPQAHFLVDTLGEYHNSWGGSHVHADSLCKPYGLNGKRMPAVARLSENELVTTVNEIDLARMFFGFNPSREVVKKLGEFASDDERTDQLLSRLKDLDKRADYAFIGWYTPMFGKQHCTLITKKSKADLLYSSISRSAFARDKCFPGDIWGPVKVGSKYVAIPSFHKKIDLKKIQQDLILAKKPFVLLRANSYYSFSLNVGRERLPPSDLALIDCYPYKNLNWKRFLKEEGEYDPQSDFLVKLLS